MPISVDIHVREMELDERMRDYVESRVTKLEHYLVVVDDASIDLR